MVETLINEARNPSFERTEGVVEVFENVAANGRWEVTNGTTEVRRNYAVNPFGAVGAFGYGAQTVTGGVAITGHPAGLTTANRVSYVAGASTPGIVFAPNGTIVSGLTYTISAWVYHETTDGGNFGLAQSGIVSGVNIPATLGQWVRHSWTFTATSTNAVGYRRDQTATGSGSFLITGMMIERSPVLGSFFGGATPASGDFTYAWTGTVNNSASVQRGVAVQYAATARSAAIQTTVDGEKALRIIPMNWSQALSSYYSGVDAYATLTGVISPVKASTTYTVLADIVIPSTLSPTSRAGFSVVLDDGTFVSPEFPKEAGNHRVRWQFTTSASPLLSAFRITPGAPGILGYSNEIILKRMAVINANYTGAYFDGYSGPAGDFTYQWNGLDIVGTSSAFAPAIPAADVGNNTSQTRVYQKSEAGRAGFARFISVGQGIAIGVNLNDAAIPDGVQRTALLLVRSSRTVQVQPRFRTPGGATKEVGGPVTLPADRWTEVRFTDAPAIGANANPSLLFRPEYGLQVGDTIDIDDHMVVLGAYDGPFFAGNSVYSSTSYSGSPDWFVYSWEGAAHNSRSIRTRQTVHEFTREWWASLPQFYQRYDVEMGEHQLMRWMEGAGRIAGSVRDVNRSMWDGTLVNPTTAPDGALRWLAMVFGLPLGQRNSPTATLRSTLVSLVESGRPPVGTRSGVAEAVKRFLIGGKQVFAVPTPGAPYVISVLVVPSDVPNNDLVALKSKIMALGVIPAGHTVVIREANSIWADWENMTWAQKEAAIKTWSDAQSHGVQL